VAAVRGGRLPPERSLAFPVSAEEAVDVNYPLDLEWAEFLLARRSGLRPPGA
jgi:hypothetical protein